MTKQGNPACKKREWVFSACGCESSSCSYTSVWWWWQWESLGSGLITQKEKANLSWFRFGWSPAPLRRVWTASIMIFRYLWWSAPALVPLVCVKMEILKVILFWKWTKSRGCKSINPHSGPHLMWLCSPQMTQDSLTLVSLITRSTAFRFGNSSARVLHSRVVSVGVCSVGVRFVKKWQSSLCRWSK